MPRNPIALVVNEEEWLGRSIEAVLVEHGYIVRRAGSGGEALKLLDEVTPDALILDRMLPDSDGATLCRRLRDDPRAGKAVPVAITSMISLSAGERAEFFRAGAWDLWGPLLEPELFATRLDTFVSARLSAERSSKDRKPATTLLTDSELSQRAQTVGAVVKRLGAPLACVAIAPRGSSQQPGTQPESPEAVFGAIGRLWQVHGRTADGVGRYSDDELGIVAPGSDSAGAIALFHRLRKLLTAGSGNDTPASVAALSAGYCASMNLAESLESVPEMLHRAATAARYAATRPEATIVSYDDVPREVRHPN